MSIRLECPTCAVILELADEESGQVRRCPQCDNVFRVPEVATGRPLPPARDAALHKSGSQRAPAPRPPRQIEAQPRPPARRAPPSSVSRPRVPIRRPEPVDEPTPIERQPARRKKRRRSSSGGVPLVVKIFGAIIMVENGFAIVIVLIAGMMTAYGVINTLKPSQVPMALGITAVGTLFYCAVYTVLFRLGQGLFNGERAAVYGLIILAVLGLGASFFLLMTEAPDKEDFRRMYTFVVLGSILFFHLPPILIALLNWRRFH